MSLRIWKPFSGGSLIIKGEAIMNPRSKFEKIFLAVFVLGIGLILCPNNTAAFSLRSSDVYKIVHSGTNYKINSLFMELNREKSYVVVGEIKIYLMDFTSGDKHYKTTFVNKQGDVSHLDSVKAAEWVGKRALVKGYRLDNGNIVAESIKRVELHRK
jgi:predicted nucleic acid-binding Zn finger protein